MQPIWPKKSKRDAFIQGDATGQGVTPARRDATDQTVATVQRDALIQRRDTTLPKVMTVQRDTPLQMVVPVRGVATFRRDVPVQKDIPFQGDATLPKVTPLQKDAALDTTFRGVVITIGRETLFGTCILIKTEVSFNAIIYGRRAKKRRQYEVHSAGQSLQQHQANTFSFTDEGYSNNELEDKLFLWGPGPDEFSELILIMTFIYVRRLSERRSKVSAQRPLSATRQFLAVLTQGDVQQHIFSYGPPMLTKPIGEVSQLKMESKDTKNALRKSLSHCQLLLEKQTQQPRKYFTEKAHNQGNKAGSAQGRFGMIKYFIIDDYNAIEVLWKSREFVHMIYASIISMKKIHRMRTFELKAKLKLTDQLGDQLNQLKVAQDGSTLAQESIPSSLGEMIQLKSETVQIRLIYTIEEARVMELSYGPEYDQGFDQGDLGQYHYHINDVMEQHETLDHSHQRYNPRSKTIAHMKTLEYEDDHQSQSPKHRTFRLT